MKPLPPHVDLYAELQMWIASKNGINDPRDVAEAIGQMFAASIVASGSDNPIEKFWRMVPDLEEVIEEMWAQSAEETV